MRLPPVDLQQPGVVRAPVRSVQRVARTRSQRPNRTGTLIRFGIAGLALALVALMSGPNPQLQVGGTRVSSVNPYDFPFTMGKPTSPTPWNPSTWDIAVHVRNGYQYGGLDTMQAQHGSNCAGAPATHTVSSYTDAVFVCNNHVMTAMSAGGYGAIYLTPDHMFDWSGGTATLSFPVSTWRTSDRDWIDMWITPFDNNLELPLESWLPDLQGPPKDALHIRMDEFNSGTIFKAEIFSNYQEIGLPNNWWTTMESLMTTSPITRSTFELDLSTSHLRFGIPGMANGTSMWWIDTGLTLPFTRGVVQLGHHSYTPDKSNGCGPPVEQMAMGLGCTANTWHWGGISMSSAVPFTLIRANDRVITPATTTGTTFPVPAPAGSFLRFNGIGTLEISLDGGKNWSTPQIQQESVHRTDHFENYWTPVPQGTTSVLFRGTSWYGGPWFARDLSIWSQSLTAGGPPPPPQPSPTPTQGPGPSPTPLPSPTASPTATPTEHPGSSPTPTPSGPPAPPGPAALIKGGVNAQPSIRPTRYTGANPDGWWCAMPNCNQNPNPMVTINSELTLASQLGVSTLRVEFPWALIETGNGVYDWSRADVIVASAIAHGVQLQPVLAFSPSWAAGGEAMAPAPADFKAFVQAIVGRYHSSIRYWEMWNEPDLSTYFSGTEAQYVADIVIPGYAGVKAADPTAQVILAGPSGWNGTWFDGVFANGGGTSFDIVAYHDYGGSPQNTAFSVQGSERAHNGNWPIWLGEYGVQESSTSDTQQQALMTAVLTSSAPLAMAQWYNLRDDFSMTCCPPQIFKVGNWGVVMHDDTTMKNGFMTMKALLASPSPSPGPSPSPTSSPSPSPSGGPTPTPSASASPSPTADPGPSPSPSSLPSPSPSPSPTAVPTPPPSPTPDPSPPTASPTPRR